jgi:hypothetical protein
MFDNIYDPLRNTHFFRDNNIANSQNNLAINVYALQEHTFIEKFIMIMK